MPLVAASARTCAREAGQRLMTRRSSGRRPGTTRWSTRSPTRRRRSWPTRSTSLMPAMFARFAGRGGAPLPALVVRDFASEARARSRCAGSPREDLAGARRARARTSNRSSRSRPPRRSAPRPRRTTTRQLVRASIGALIDALARQPVTLPRTSDRGQAMQLVRGDDEAVRAGRARRPWLRALVAAGCRSSNPAGSSARIRIKKAERCSSLEGPMELADRTSHSKPSNRPRRSGRRRRSSRGGDARTWSRRARSPTWPR